LEPKALDLLTRGWQSQASLSLFLFLLILMAFVIPSVRFANINTLALYEDIGFASVSIVGAAIAWRNRKLFLLTSLVAIVAILLRWATWWRPTNALFLWSISVGLAAILTLTAVLLWQVFRSGPVTVMRIQGAIAAYLCLGFGWAHAYHLAALLDPHAFEAAGSNVSFAISWVNYSFGMLTTVGYGGFVPVDPLAHTLTSAEAVTGQFYLAVLVARLVSMQVSDSRKA
jgi:hypothetical protein